MMNQMDLGVKLKEQIQLIEFNLNRIGDLELLALNLAVNVRVLVHDTQRSTSLLRMMSKKEVIQYYDTSTPIGAIAFWKGNFSINGWDLSSLPHIGIVGKEINVLSPTECQITYTPIFQDWTIKNSLVSFEDWWNTEIFDNNQGITLTRKQLILNATNKDGGAHIDEPSMEYIELTKKDVLPFTLNNVSKSAENIPAYSCIAQIAWELVESIKDAELV